MASQASVATSQPDQRHLRLIAAAAQGNEARVHDILAEELSWTSSVDQDILRQALQKVAARGNLSIVRLLIQHATGVNAQRANEVSALIKAAEGGHKSVVSELLGHHADPNCRDRNGKTVLFAACLKGHDAVVRLLLDAGADVEAHDKEGRTPLLFLASEKQGRWKWTINTIKLLLDHKAQIEVKDQIGRTPLLWATTNGNVELVRVLLASNANVHAFNNRGRTALHLAAAETTHKERLEDMVRLLLDSGADPCLPSDGGWTPLHNASQSDNANIVAILLQTRADPNAQLTNGMTPLHWAASNGFTDIVQLLLSKPETNLSIKDSFDRTPMLCAAQEYNTEIVELLSPARAADRLSPMAKAACEAFEATVVDFGDFEKKQLVSKHSVYDLLYGWDEENRKPTIPTLTKNIKYKPDFRWIHLPANNIAWVEALLAKSFIEAGHRDIEAFKALEKCLDQEHSGHFSHAHFMRTCCQKISTPQQSVEIRREDRALTPLSEEDSEMSANSTQQSTSGLGSMNANDHSEENGTRKSETKRKNKSEQIAERHPKKHKRGKGPPGNPPRQISNLSNSSAKLSVPLSWDTSRSAAAAGKIILFMPFLHHETEDRRIKMSNAIRMVNKGGKPTEKPSKDSLLLDAYLNNAPRLHIRRTLDQFAYHGIDTSVRDTDQVVSRYCESNRIEKKVFMVDQLWLWIIGKDLIITCFPQRWDQPKQDPLNVLDGIIEETNAKTRPPIQSVYDLAMLITGRCASVFDRHQLHDQDYQFFDMFEHSIGVVTDKESRLFRRFNKASEQSTHYLRHQQERKIGRDSSTILSDALLDIRTETKLLAEIKDIRDELNILLVILGSQISTLLEFEETIIDEIRSSIISNNNSNSSSEGGSGSNRRATEAAIAEIRKRSREQLRRIEFRQRDLDRMDGQAEGLYMSLRDLLDLKQKHSNALEARFAGDQAVIAARQGQTIMMFTIVTIVFLPMSFIAAFFAINLPEWEGRLTIGYVSKYMFGIGLGISIPLITMAVTFTDIIDGVREHLDTLKRKLRGTNKNKHGGEGRGERNRSRSRAGVGDGDDDDDKEGFSRGDLSKLDKITTMPSRGRPSMQYYRHYNNELDKEYWRGNSRAPSTATNRRIRYEVDGGGNDLLYGRLSPISMPSRGGVAAGVNGNAPAVSWATRPSLERGRRDHGDDLERGRSGIGPSSPRRW